MSHPAQKPYPRYPDQPPSAVRADRLATRKPEVTFVHDTSNTATAGTESGFDSAQVLPRALGPSSLKPATNHLASRFSRDSDSSTSQKTRNSVRFSLPKPKTDKEADEEEDEVLSPGYETDSLASDVSTSTQATSVASDVTVTGNKSSNSGPSRFPSAGYHAQPVPQPAQQYPPPQHGYQYATAQQYSHHPQPLPHQSPFPQAPHQQPSFQPPALPQPHLQHSPPPSHHAPQSSLALPQQNRTLRRVPSTPSVRVKPRLATRTRPVFESHARPQQSTNTRRTLHIEVKPAANGDSNMNSRELELYKKSERDLLDKIGELEAETRTLRIDQNRLLQDLDEAVEKLSNSGRERDAARIESTLGDTARYRLMHELDEQRRILDEVRNKHEHEKRSREQAEKERDELKGTNERLVSKMGILESEITKLEKSISRAGADMERDQRSHASEQDALGQQVETLEAAKRGLEAKMTDKEKDLTAVITERNVLREECDKRQGQIDLLSEDKRRLVDDRDVLQARVFGLEEEKEDVKEKLTTAESTIEKLKSTLEAVENEKFDLIRRVQAAEADRAKVTTTLDVQQGDMETMVDALIIERDGVKDANISLASQKLDAERETALVRELLGNAEAESRKLKDDLEALGTEKERLETRVKELEDLRAADNAESLRQQMADLEARANDLQEQADKVPVLDSAKTETEAKMQQLQVEADKVPPLTAQKTELEGKVDELQARLDKIPELAADRAALDAQQVAFAEKQAAHDAAAADFETQKAALEQRAGEVPGLQDQLQAAEAQLGEARAAREAADAQVGELKARIADMEAQLGHQVQMAVAARAALERAVAGGGDGGKRASRARSQSVATTARKKGPGSTASTAVTNATSSSNPAEKLVMMRSRATRGTLIIAKKNEVKAPKRSPSAPDSD